jgi:hypothetical protein
MGDFSHALQPMSSPVNQVHVFQPFPAHEEFTAPTPRPVRRGKHFDLYRLAARHGQERPLALFAMLMFGLFAVGLWLRGPGVEQFVAIYFGFKAIAAAVRAVTSPPPFDPSRLF